jgi:hypothetical protein
MARQNGPVPGPAWLALCGLRAARPGGRGAMGRPLSPWPGGGPVRCRLARWWPVDLDCLVFLGIDLLSSF